MMNFRNPRYNQFDGIDMDIEHPVLGWIGFTASPDDPEKSGRDLYHEALQNYVAPYVPAQELPPKVPQFLTPLEARLGLRAWGIGREEVANFFLTIEDPVQREVAEDTWEYASLIERNNPLILGFAAFLNKTEEEIDDFFRDNKGRTL